MSESPLPPKQAGEGFAPKMERKLFYLSLLLYSICLALPSFVFASPATAWTGGQALLLGWLGILVGQVGWLANPVYYLSLMFLLKQRSRFTLIASGVALVLAANTLLLFSQDIPANEGGVDKLKLETLGPAFYIWMISLVIPLLSDIRLLKR